MLFDSISRKVETRYALTHEEKIWLIDTINNHLSNEGKEKLYALMTVYIKREQVLRSTVSGSEKHSGDLHPLGGDSGALRPRRGACFSTSANASFDSVEPFYDINSIPSHLQKIWFEFTKMHLITQNERVAVRRGSDLRS